MQAARSLTARPPVEPRKEPLRTTMLDLVVSLQQSGLGEHEVVATARSLIQSGRAVLTGNFANCPLGD